jgi:hypothetical protein
MPYKNPNSEAAVRSRRERHNRYVARHRERYLAGKRKRSYRDRQVRLAWERRNRSRRLAIVRKHIKKNPAWQRAYNAVQYALRTGRLVRAECCQSCAVIEKVQAHHHRGYAKEFRLDVVWLCFMCHKRTHRLESVKIRKPV